MNATTNFAATIGLDWADQKHDLWLQPADGSESEHLQLPQNPEALHEWVAKLRERFDNRPLAIGIETSRGAVLSALLAYDFIVFFPVNPKALKDYRAAFSVSGAKDDRTDAMLLEEFIRLHRQKLQALEPDTALTRTLAGLVENRRHLVDERTRLVNQLHSCLKTYYPLGETLLDGHLNKPMAADFLARWPDLETLKKADPKTLRSFFYKHNSRGASKMEERLQTVQKAKALTTDPAIIIPARGLVGALVSVNDFAIRPARTLKREDSFNTGKHRFRFLPTPHVPHGWDAGVMFEETKQILFCSDLFHQWGERESLSTESIIDRCRDALMEAEAGPFAGYVPYTHHTGRVLEELAVRQPRTLAVMHGSSFSGDCARALRELATVMAEVLGPKADHGQTTSEGIIRP